MSREVARESGDYDAVLGPMDAYLRNCGRELGRAWDVILTTRRPAPVADLLLSGYVVPYEAVIDGKEVPVSAEAVWAAKRRAEKKSPAVLSRRVVDGSREDEEAPRVVPHPTIRYFGWP